MCLLHSCMASASSAVKLRSVLQDSLDPEYQRMNKERSQAAAAKNRTLQVLACCHTPIFLHALQETLCPARCTLQS